MLQVWFSSSQFSTQQIQAAFFNNVNRDNIMHTVFDNGDTSRPFFIVEGSKLQFWTLDKDNRLNTENIFYCLPRGSISVTHKDV